jgi:hypothetical protein
VKLGPIVGEQPLPVNKRPKCMYCGKPLRPRITTNWGQGLLERISRTFEGTYGEFDLFCGPHHAAAYGRIAAREIKKKQERK